MLATEREILHRLLTHFHPNDFEEYFKFYEEPERVQLAKIKLQTEPLELSLDNSSAIFNRIHYSWFIASLEKWPQALVDQSYSIFSSEQVKGLTKMGCFKKPNKTKDAFSTQFYKGQLLKEVGYTTLPPLSILPYTESRRFLTCSKKQLVKFVIHLGLLELANISKKIVDKKVLSQIEKMLSASQKKIYALAKKSMEPKTSSVRDFAQHLKNKKSFSHFIEKRGLERFARGIVLDHPYFVWHIGHILDKGRGQELLMKSRRFLPNPFTPFYNKQVLEVSDTLTGGTRS